MNHSSHDRVIALLNEAAVEASESKKVECLLQVQELILRKEPALLESFLEEFLAFQVDRKGEVRKCVVGFVEEVCKKDMVYLHQVVPSLLLLVRDPVVAVQKRVIQAWTHLHKLTLAWVSKIEQVTEQVEDTWNSISQLKTELAKMIDHDNDGVRSLTVKFYETLILTQTYLEPDSVKRENEFTLDDVPLTLKIARPRKLEEEARTMLDDLLKFHGSAHVTSANLMACLSTLTIVAKGRPQFVPQIVRAFEKLHANLPPTLAKSQVCSVRKHLKSQLLAVLHVPAAYEFSATIVAILNELGASQQDIAKAMPKLEEVRKYKRSDRVEPPAKKARLEEVKTSQRTPNNHAAAVELTEKFITERMNPELATNLVLANIRRLPSTMPPTFVASHVPIHTPGVHHQVRQITRMLASQLVGAGIGPGIERYGATAANPPEVPMEDEEDEQRVSSLPSEQRPKPEVVDKKYAPPPAARKPRTLKLSEISKPLSVETKNRMTLLAIQRILKAEKTAVNGGVGILRSKIIANLASNLSNDLREPLLEFLLEDFQNRMDLALAWLYQEYGKYMGFQRGGQNSKDAEAYANLFCSLVNGLKNKPGVKEKDVLLSRLYLEAPCIPEAGVELLRKTSTDPTMVVVAVDLLRQLALQRPTKQHAFLNGLLELVPHENAEIRGKAISTLLVLYERGELRHSIEDYATLYLRFLLKPSPPEVLFGEERGRVVQSIPTAWTEEIARTCLYLVLALLPENHKLIHELAAVYVQTTADVKRAILRQTEGPVKLMSMDSPELLRLVENCPKGAETLVTRIIHILTDKVAPSTELVSRVRDLYQKRVPDVRFLIPVLHGLTKKEVIAALPKLIKLNPIIVKEVFNRLLGTHVEGSSHSPLTPAELLIALHNIDTSKCDMKTVMKATSLCFSERQIYTQEVLAVVMQQLMEQSPLPTLLMRTVLQSLSVYPRLLGFTMNILQRLILKQVWKQKKVWEGFIKCCQRTKPQSFSVLLQLPPTQLHEVLSTCPDLREPLLAHVMAYSDSQRLHIPGTIMDVLMGVADNPPSEETKKDDEQETTPMESEKTDEKNEETGERSEKMDEKSEKIDENYDKIEEDKPVDERAVPASENAVLDEEML